MPNMTDTHVEGAADEDHGVAPGNEEVHQEIPAPPALQPIPPPFLHAYIPQTYYGMAPPPDKPPYTIYLFAQLHDLHEFMIQQDMHLITLRLIYAHLLHRGKTILLALVVPFSGV
ncbi:hypothetical protein Syun_003834 [Stephania yunnanensis]|uniref:Uncharacterized protein n=1 Tax=Stephania yunnanensis TaxID=152371 RepID=A0AAP0L3G1_9MAGN